MISRSYQSFSQTHSEEALGCLVAGALSGVWRESPPRENLSDETLALITPLLYASGSAALGWWRIRTVGSGQWSENKTQSDFAARCPPPTAHSLLHDAYRRSRLNALIHEQELKHILSLLRAAGIEPVLVKGWAIARHYPDRALRPYGDFDLCIRPDQFAQAEQALKCLESIDGHYVDLHDGFAKLEGERTPNFEHAGASTLRRSPLRGSAAAQCGRAAPFRPRVINFLHEAPPHETEAQPRKSAAVAVRQSLTALCGGQGAKEECWDELFERSQLVDLGDEKIRVLSDEDHLRVLCLHLLRSGAWRPLWLCDIAVAVESRRPDFDWARCFGADPLIANWVACTIGLAHQLLGADVSDTPIAERAKDLPRWLAPAVLRQWGRAKGSSETKALLPTLFKNLGRPAAMIRELHERWDRPVIATFNLRAPLNNFPRSPYQFADMLRRGANVPKQLALVLSEQMRRFRFESFRRVAAPEH